MFEKGYILFSLYSSYSPSSRNVGLYQFCFPVTAEVPSFLQLHRMYCNLTVSPTSLCFLTPLCYPTSQLLTYPLMSAHVPVSMKPDEAKFNLYTFRFFLLHVILLNTQLVIFFVFCGFCYTTHSKEICLLSQYSPYKYWVYIVQVNLATTWSLLEMEEPVDLVLMLG